MSSSPFNPVEAHKAEQSQQQQERKVLRIISPPAILCFPYIFTPKKGKKPTDQPRFKATLLFRMHPSIDLKPLNELVVAALFKKWGGVKPAKYRSPWRSGDEIAAQYPEFKGCIYVEAKAAEQPGARRLALPTDLPEMITKGTVPCQKEDLYAGCIVRASLSAYAYDQEENRGVSFALNSILKIGDGKRLGGGRPAEEEFEGVGAGPAEAYSDVMQAQAPSSSTMISGLEVSTPHAEDDDIPF